MRSESHDDVARDGEADGTRTDGPGRRFDDKDGRWWEGTWQPPAGDSSREPHGRYVFRAADGTEEYSLPASSPAGDRLARMTLGDVRQLLALARSYLLDR